MMILRAYATRLMLLALAGVLLLLGVFAGRACAYEYGGLVPSKRSKRVVTAIIWKSTREVIACSVSRAVEGQLVVSRKQTSFGTFLF